MLPSKDIKELLEISTSTLKSLSFRNIVVLCLLSIIGTGVYAILYLLRSENRSLLVEISGRARIVQAIDTCVVGKFYQGNNDFYAITRNYYGDNNVTFYTGGILDNLPQTTKELRDICSLLEKDSNTLKQANAPHQDNSLPGKIIDKTKELLNQQ